MEQSELTDELVSAIRREGIIFKGVPHLDVIAVINPTKRIGAYDKNRATPQDIAHEYYHVKLRHQRRKHTNDFTNEQETECNYYSAKLLWNIFIQQGGTIEYSQHFLTLSGCEPYWLERILEDNPSVAYI